MNDIGRFQAANMGLLKTIFEMNLQLFKENQAELARSKTLLLFIVRDYINTPIEKLKSTLLADLDKLWKGITKPEHFADSKVFIDGEGKLITLLRERVSIEFYPSYFDSRGTRKTKDRYCEINLSFFFFILFINYLFYYGIFVSELSGHKIDCSHFCHSRLLLWSSFSFYGNVDNSANDRFGIERRLFCLGQDRSKGLFIPMKKVLT